MTSIRTCLKLFLVVFTISAMLSSLYYMARSNILRTSPFMVNQTEEEETRSHLKVVEVDLVVVDSFQTFNPLFVISQESFPCYQALRPQCTNERPPKPPSLTPLPRSFCFS